jgi:hypothetical protein
MRHHVAKEVNTFGRHDGEHNYKRSLKVEFADYAQRPIARRRPMKSVPAHLFCQFGVRFSAKAFGPSI